MSIVNPRLTFTAHTDLQASRTKNFQGHNKLNNPEIKPNQDIPLDTLKAYFAPTFTGFFGGGLNKKETIDKVVQAIQQGKAENLTLDKKDREASKEYDNDDYEIRFRNTEDDLDYLVESVNILEPSLGATAAAITTTKYAITVDDPSTPNPDQYVEISAEEFQRLFELAEGAVKNL